MLNKMALRDLSYGIYIVSAVDNGKMTGCVANSIIQISTNTVAMSLNQKNNTNRVIKASGEFAISVLSETVNPDIIPVFGFSTGKDTEKFKNIEYELINNLPVVKNSVAWFTLKTRQTIEVEEHTLFVADITDGGIFNDEIPMTYKYYHEVIKGSAPKEAPTYIEPGLQKSINAKSYRCKVCGYIYQGDITKELPNYLCPVCKQPKSVFEEISYA